MTNLTIVKKYPKSVVIAEEKTSFSHLTDKKSENFKVLSSKKMKIYSTTLVFDNWIKRLHLEGEDCKYFETQFDKACVGLNEVGDNSIECTEFFVDAIQHFKKYGFIRIAK